MNCKSVEDLLWGLCEGCLDDARVRSVEEHLAICGTCRRARAQIRSTLAAMRGLAQVEPSPGFEARLWQRIGAWETRRRTVWLTVFAAFLARNRRLVAASVLVFAVALFSGLYTMRSMVGGSQRVAKGASTGYEGVGLTEGRQLAASGSDVRQDFVLREIPYSAPVLTVSNKDNPDTIYTRFPTRDLTPPRGSAGDNYVYEPVVTPVSGSEPVF